MKSWDVVTADMQLTIFAIELADGSLRGPTSGAQGKSYGRWFISRRKAEAELASWGGVRVIEGTINWSKA